MSEFAKQWPLKIWLMCDNVFWKGRFDYEASRFDGLGSFMRYYGITMYSTVQFEIYGDDIFKIKILKANAVECNYPSTDVEEYIKKKTMKSGILKSL